MHSKYLITVLIFWSMTCLLLIVFRLSGENQTLKNGANVANLPYKKTVEIQNRNISDFDLVIVVQVHNRSIYLRKLIESLSESAEIEKTLLIFSHDIKDEILFENIANIQFARYMQIFYPFSLQTHPDRFPGPDSNDCQPFEKPKPDCQNINYTDTYRHFRDAKAAQMKHHWWWKINFVFAKIDELISYSGLVLLLEEDHYVSPDFIYSLKMMEEYSKRSCPHCWFYALGAENYQHNSKLGHNAIIRSSVENLGLAFNRTIWRQIQEYADVFCEFDDYNWDWTLRHIVNDIIKPKPRSIIMTDRKLMHIGSCGTHTKEKICDASDIIRDFKSRQVALFPKVLKVKRVMFAYSIRNNGGWGDPRDKALCLNMTFV